VNPSHTIERVFLGLSSPVLASAARWLCTHSDHPQGPGPLDLSHWIIVTPGARAGRVLLAQMIETAAHAEPPANSSAAGGLIPPRFTTPGSLMDRLAPSLAPRGIASPIERTLGWIAALRATPRAELAALMPRLPEADDLAAWISLAELLARWHEALAGEGLIARDVPVRVRNSPGWADWPDEARWLAVASVQDRYAEMLRAAGRSDPHLDRIERVRMNERPDAPVAPAGTERIALVGVADLPGIARSLLRRSGLPITTLIAADSADAAGYDELGCINPAWWSDRVITLDDAQIAFADGPREQAELAIAQLGQWSGRFDTGQAVIGTTSDELAAHVERAARTIAGLPVHRAEGLAITQAPAVRLLGRAAQLVARADFRSLMEFVRDPAIESELQRSSPRGAAPAWWLDPLDRYEAESLPGPLKHLPEPRSNHSRALTLVLETVDRLLGPLSPLADGPSRQSLSNWARAALGMLDRALGEREARRSDTADRLTIESCVAVADAASAICTAAAPLLPGPVTAAEALSLLLKIVSKDRTAVEPEPDAIELLGWLELALDPAPAAVVLGMNEGSIPARRPNDGLLTDWLRQRLDLPDAARRLARDRAALETLRRTKHALLLVAGRFSGAGDPLWPSRLLLGPAGTEQAQRILRFTARHEHAHDAHARRCPRPRHISSSDGFTVAPVGRRPVISSLAVTSFKHYLSSPYLFYLRHGLHLEERPIPPAELEGSAFGSLLHGTLHAFAQDPARDSKDADIIFQACRTALDRSAAQIFGALPSLPVRLQLERAHERLRAFASWQAKRRRDGWQILHSEWSPTTGQVPFLVDDEPIGLRGRIDRIDQHDRGDLAILDYKTGDTVTEPEPAHLTRAGWIDLQLPLYCHLAAELLRDQPPDAAPVLGYIVVPKKLEEVGLRTAFWLPTQLATADEAAREIVRAIRRGDFAELGTAPDDTGSFARLCGTGVVGQLARYIDNEPGAEDDE
jgi:ATP-dependent helicase/nuclease subunit B